MLTFRLAIQIVSLLTLTGAMLHQGTTLRKSVSGVLLRDIAITVSERQESCSDGYSICEAFGSGCCQTGQACCSSDNITVIGQSVSFFRNFILQAWSHRY
jgi:hypothetical protein